MNKFVLLQDTDGNWIHGKRERIFKLFDKSLTKKEYKKRKLDKDYDKYKDVELYKLYSDTKFFKNKKNKINKELKSIKLNKNSNNYYIVWIGRSSLIKLTEIHKLLFITDSLYNAKKILKDNLILKKANRLFQPNKPYKIKQKNKNISYIVDIEPYMGETKNIIFIEKIKLNKID
jgi:hypothetical protein